ncbi:VC0807 family protein [Streptomyces lydicus]|uniref:VC0807 family protein n=1 Tax=Streptomyces lydicus TaxID=47763 RepID=UPI0038253538
MSQHQTAAEGTPGNPLVQSLVPLIVDAGIPIASYFVLSDGFGLGTVAALGWSSVVPALRTVWGLVRSRAVNGLALLMLVVNVVGLATSVVAGDARLMMAKDSAVSSTVGIVILLSLRSRRPLMTAGLKPWVTKGSPAGNAAWDRLLASSERFRRAERRFSAIWGGALLTECVLKVIGAYTLPVHTMVWLGTVLTVVFILLAMVIAGGSCAEPMEKMVKAESERAAGTASGAAGTAYDAKDTSYDETGTAHDVPETAHPAAAGSAG